MAGQTDGRKKGLMATLAIVMLLSLMAAGAGFSVGILLQPEMPRPAEAASAPAAPESSSPGEEAGKPTAEETAMESEPVQTDLRVIPFPPVLTTLSAPEGKWIRLEGAILAAPGTTKTPELLAEQSGEQILSYLRTVRLEQLQGASGLLALRDDLEDTVKTMSGGEVQGILIHGLIVE